MKRTILVLALTLLLCSASPVMASHNGDQADAQTPSASIKMFIQDTPDSTSASGTSGNGDTVIPGWNLLGAAGLSMILWFLG